MRTKYGTLALALAFAAGVFLSACGGGTSGSSPSAAGNNSAGSATVTLNVPPPASKGARAVLSGTKYFSVVVTLPGSPTVVASGAAQVINGTGTVTVTGIPTG